MTGDRPYRKHLKRWESPRSVRFITFSCEKRLPLFRNPAVCKVFIDALVRVRQSRGIELYAWAVMPEHVHLLLRSGPSEPLERTLRSLKVAVSKRVIERWRSLDAPILARLSRPDGGHRFWLKGGGFDRTVRDSAEFSRTVRYIHRNPVERGLVEHAEDWQWSSVRWWMGRREGEIACDPPPVDDASIARWRGYV
ncbi:MAG: transposase [Phycisphaerales bacterium]|nr:MAG: transposase [Phycisphaerales bacterium]